VATFEGPDLDAAMGVLAGAVHHRELPPRQPGELGVQGWLVGLDDQQVGGVLLGDQPVSMSVLGVERVGGDDGVGQVQVVQQRPELGDLVGRVVHLGLCQDRAGGVVHRRQQVHLPVAVVAAAA
jgi:hypothetical protein